MRLAVGLCCREPLDPRVAEYEPNGVDLIRHGVRIGVDLLHARRWRGRDVCSADPVERLPGLRLDGPRTARRAAGGRSRLLRQASVIPLAESGVTANGSYPATVGTRGDGFRATFMNDRAGEFNVWERQSTNGGATWSPQVRLCGASTGAQYVNS